MKRDFSYEAYLNGTHRLGRIFSVLTLIMLTGAPFAIGGILGAMPDLAAAARGFIAVGLVWTVSAVVEYLVYPPMLGAGGSYLAFITGNLINMKIPCAMNAREMTGAKTGTAEHASGGSDHGAFVCFAHRKDETQPDIAVAVFGEKIAHGSTLAPVAEKILLTYYEMDAASEMTAFENQAG